MLKGIDMTDYEPKMCSEFGDNNERLRINKNIEPENCFKYVCPKEYNEFKLDGHNPNDLALEVDPNDLNERVEFL